jgi:hypothetical protein
MTTQAKIAEMYERIKQHGHNLLNMFPDATLTNPVKLCKRLRRAETEANRLAVDWCNGLIDEATWETGSERIRDRVNRILGTDRVWINGDPRGYALKVDLQPEESLHKDWGGYGIIAPDLS